jgi:hypothetical protein
MENKSSRMEEGKVLGRWKQELKGILAGEELLKSSFGIDVGSDVRYNAHAPGCGA